MTNSSDDNSGPSKSLLRFYWHFIAKHKFKFSALMVTATIFAFSQSFTPYLVKLIIDKVVGFKGDPKDIYLVLGTPVTLYIILRLSQSFFMRIEDIIQAYTLPQVKTEIRTKLFNMVQKHSYRFFQETMSGNIAKKTTDMPNSFEKVFLAFHDAVYISLISFLFSIFLLWKTSPVFALFLIGWFVLVVAGTLFFSNRSIIFSKEYAEAKSVTVGDVVDVFRNIITVKMFNHQKYESDYLDKLQKSEVKSAINLEWAMIKVHIFRSSTTSVLIIGMILLLVHGWQQGWVSVGDFAFVSSTCFSISHMIWHVSKQLVIIYKQVGYGQQALDLILQPIEIADIPNAPALDAPVGKIDFKNVTFYYSPENQIFKSKTITINAKQKVGLVGFSGSGKTTFINLILRFFDPYAGKILIDSQNIKNVSLKSLRNNISVIPQDPGLFDRSILENVKYGRLDATKEDVIKACKQAHCHDIISKLTDGYNTIVGESGSKLSGGQKQRIAIARAILKDAPILILDEATSALDSVTEHKIQESIEYIIKDRTAIVIAHRLSTLINMDRILVFKNGEIIEDGSPEELLKTNGYYNRLWNMQAGGFLPGEQEE